MRKALVSMTLIAALGVPAAGCGDDEDEETGTTEPAPTTQPEKPAAGGTVEVTIKDTKFVPADGKAKVGQTVVWTNEDGIPHTVTKDKGPGPDFDSGNVQGGDTYKRKFTAAGKIDYLCTIHPGQEGTLTVSK